MKKKKQLARKEIGITPKYLNYVNFMINGEHSERIVIKTLTYMRYLKKIACMEAFRQQTMHFNIYTMHTYR